MKKHKNDLKGSRFVFYKVLQNQFTLPKELQKIPFANDDMVQVDKIHIRNAFAPYNASIIEKENGYFLFFRYDIVQQMYYNKINAYVGCVELDEDLQQTKNEYFTIDTNSTHSEDPRVLRMGEEYLMVFNDIFSQDMERRGMHISKIDFESRKAYDICPLDLKLNSTEKNWAPFIYQSADKKDTICFEYRVFHPRSILQINNSFDPENVEIHQQSASMASIPWNKKWGKPLGGTPARLIDGEYLAFFHSKFTDKTGIYWYVFGAYTFESSPPFRIKAVSPHPILFKGIYDSEYLNTAEPAKCVIFPGGFAIKEANGREQILLTCGENDSSIKLITFDKDELLQSLVSVR